MRNHKIVRPIVFIDLETTGLGPTWDRIVELTALKVFQRPQNRYRIHARIISGTDGVAKRDPARPHF